MKIHFLESADWPKSDIAQDLTDAITLAYNEASKLLPSKAEEINFIVRPEEKTIPETGSSGWAYDKSLVKIGFDPSLPYGKESLLDSIRSTVFHEYCHTVRWSHATFANTIIEGAVLEGLATVFERDYADCKQKPLWGLYDSDAVMTEWLDELIALNDDWSKYNDYAFFHPDGRRWIIYKVGTWLIDKVIQEQSVTVADIVGKETDYFLPKGAK